MTASEYNKYLKSQWSKHYDDDTLRKGYERLAREYNNEALRKYLDDDDIFKMNTFKEILIERKAW